MTNVDKGGAIRTELSEDRRKITEYSFWNRNSIKGISNMFANHENVHNIFACFNPDDKSKLEKFKTVVHKFAFYRTKSVDGMVCVYTHDFGPVNEKMIAAKEQAFIEFKSEINNAENVGYIRK